MADSLLIPASHPAYAGHFPGNPVLPGVVLLDAALQVVAAALAGAVPNAAGRRSSEPPAFEIVSAKFHRFVRPGESLAIEHERLANETVRFSIRSAQHPVASGIVKLSSAAGSPDGQRTR